MHAQKTLCFALIAGEWRYKTVMFGKQKDKQSRKFCETENCVVVRPDKKVKIYRS